MSYAVLEAQVILDHALALLETEPEPLFTALDELPAPIYVTDALGVVTYFNPACINFAGRTPEVGKDKWCVTWKLFTNEGEFLPHDRCPMAEAIIKKQPIRGVTAMAERPDGTRVTFMPYPTPMMDASGELRGAVNMLIDVTDQRQAGALRAQALRCRRLASGVSNGDISETLNRLADEYEEKAVVLDAESDPFGGFQAPGSMRPTT
jgi:PAS domain S-box-containing protein